MFSKIKEVVEIFEKAGYKYETMSQKASRLRDKLRIKYEVELGNMSLKELEVDLAMQEESLT